MNHIQILKRWVEAQVPAEVRAEERRRKKAEAQILDQLGRFLRSADPFERTQALHCYQMLSWASRRPVLRKLLQAAMSEQPEARGPARQALRAIGFEVLVFFTQEIAKTRKPARRDELIKARLEIFPFPVLPGPWRLVAGRPFLPGPPEAMARRDNLKS
jgi:hypothetical protein